MATEDFDKLLVRAIRDLDQQEDPARTLGRLVEIAPEFFEQCDYVGVSLVERGGIRTPAATTERLREVDQLQFDLGEGPCLDAIGLQATVVVDDLATDVRWPAWGKLMVREMGVRSSVSFRLFSRGDSSWGALNVYSTEPGAFSSDDVLHGQVVAAMSAVLLARSIKDEQLATALASRTVIGQAIGMVMERYGLDEDAAFQVMRRIASQDNRKIRDLAADVVAERGLPGRPTEPAT